MDRRNAYSETSPGDVQAPEELTRGFQNAALSEHRVGDGVREQFETEPKPQDKMRYDTR